MPVSFYSPLTFGRAHNPSCHYEHSLSGQNSCFLHRYHQMSFCLRNHFSHLQQRLTDKADETSEAEQTDGTS